MKNRDGYAAAVCGWWLGHSLVDVAPYMNDARTQRLMLLGGGTGADIEGHDWTFLLEHFHALKLDLHLAHAVLRAGRALMVAALLVAVVFAGCRVFSAPPDRTRFPSSGPRLPRG